MRTGNEHHILAFLHWLKESRTIEEMNPHQLVDWIETVVRDPGGQVAPAWVAMFDRFEKSRNGEPK